VARIPSGQIIQALVRSVAPGPDRSDGNRNLRALGRSLAEWGAAAPDNIEELVRVLLWNHLSRQACLWEGLLRKYGGQPAFWADDVRQLLAVLREALPGKDFTSPPDLAEAFGADAACARLQRLVRRFGELLQVWPDMVEAARDLRARGLRLAGALDGVPVPGR
jgi:hypothetical protein